MRDRKDSVKPEVNVLGLIEESIFLVRSTFFLYGWIYYIATIPFILTFIDFLGIMRTRSIMPYEIARFAFVLTLLFWVKVAGQSLYCQRLLAARLDQSPGHSLAYYFRIILQSIILHAISVPLLLISGLLLIPFGYAFAYSQYLYLASGGLVPMSMRGGMRGGMRGCMKDCYKFSLKEPGRQRLLLLFLCALFCVIFLNMGVMIYAVPYIGKVFFGMETAFTLSSFSIFTTTFVVTVLSVSYLILDPIVKGCYVTLYFYLQTKASGEDIMVTFKRVSKVRYGAVCLLIMLGFSVRSDSAAKAPPQEFGKQESIQDMQTVDPQKRGRMKWAIEEASREEVYRWRYKGLKKGDEDSKGFFVRMVSDLLKTLQTWLRPVGRFLKRIFNPLWKYIKKWLQGDDRALTEKPTRHGGDLWPRLITTLIICLFLIMVVYLFVLHFKDKVEVIQRPKRSAPDLLSQDVDATQLAEDEWLLLSREFQTKGDLALALRSAFLAILSFFHRNNYLVFEQYKTNYNYLAEVRRNARQHAALAEGFISCIEIFEKSWYGRYPVNESVFEMFEKKRQQIMEGTS